MVSPYPLLFEPILKPKVWGGRGLVRLGKNLPPDVLVGEAWEVADLAASSPGGGGGGPERSRILAGPLAGATLTDAMAAWGEGLLGEARPAPDGGFPLLVKLLDARQNLSVQVHPPPGWQGGPADAFPKSECWYVLRAEPRTRIWKGLRPGIDRRELAGLLRDDRLPDVLLSEPAEPGQLHWLPGGTIHALGGGIQVLEVQTPSDTTFRLYDWTREYDRPSRGLHHDQALACAALTPPLPAARLPEGSAGDTLLRAPGFEVEEHLLAPGRRLTAGDGSRPAVLHVLAGRLEVDPYIRGLATGNTCLVPAAITERTMLRAGPTAARLLLIRPG